MSTVLWDKYREQQFENAMLAVGQELLIISPFIRRSILEHLLPRKPIRIRVITRFNLRDFYSGVSDLDALQLLLSRNAEIKWARAGGRLTSHQIAKWQCLLWGAPRAERGSHKPRFPDFGSDLGVEADPSPVELPITQEDVPQFFVKFFGLGNSRSPLDTPVMDEIERSGSHWACTYPKGKRPRQVRDGAVMFIARMVDGPDIRVYGRATGRAHRDGEDDASRAEIAIMTGRRSGRTTCACVGRNLSPVRSPTASRSMRS
jgi:hypothetical protein